MKTAKFTWFDRQVLRFEEARFGAMAVMLAVQTCWGSIAAGLSYNNDTLLNLSICASFSMLNNMVLIAQGPAKYCVAIFYLATLANTSIILIEVLGG